MHYRPGAVGPIIIGPPCSHPPNVSPATPTELSTDRTGGPGSPSFRELFVTYAPYVFRVLRRLGVLEGDLDDVCQEVFVIVHRKLPEFDGRSSAKTWVYGICLRTASDYRRSARIRHEELRAQPPEPGEVPPPHDQLERRRALALLEDVLATLDDAKRAVFVLYELEELPMTEVAQAVGCPLQTAYSRLHAARRRVEAVFRARTAEPGEEAPR